MARFFMKNGKYFETITEVEPDKTGVWPDGRVEVPQRPSVDHVWQDGVWVMVPNPDRLNEEAKFAAARQELAKPMPADLPGLAARLSAIELILGIR